MKIYVQIGLFQFLLTVLDDNVLSQCNFSSFDTSKSWLKCNLQSKNVRNVYQGPEVHVAQFATATQTIQARLKNEDFQCL